MISAGEVRTVFHTPCPYCGSIINIKANRKLKFKTYYFENQRGDEIYKYRHVPIWRCPCCKQKFAVDMISQKTYTEEHIPEMGIMCIEVPREEFFEED